MKTEKNYDVIIIGAGVAGGATARELSRFKLDVLALEKEIDVCCGISKANTGIIHSPALIPGGTLKARMAVRGAAFFEQLSRELGFGYQRSGALVTGFSPEDEAWLQEYIAAGRDNYHAAGIEPPEFGIVKGERLKELEPSLSPDVCCALRLPDCGRIIPYEYGIALWENAVANGTELRLGVRVQAIEADSRGSGWIIRTPEQVFRSRFVVNAAGHGSSRLGGETGFSTGSISAVKGQYLILERGRGPDLRHILFQVPRAGEKKKGKGILVTKTVYGNIMIGPDARRQDGEDTATDIEALDEVVRGALRSVPELNPADCIKTFAGVRPRPAGGDFIIESGRGFVHLCGIESPGLTASPAIALDVVRRLRSMGLGLTARTDFCGSREPVVRGILDLESEELKRRTAMEQGEPGRLVCRCEQVPEDRIIDAIGRGIPVLTTDGIKRRTRAGQGRCQGGFCRSRVKSLLAAELNLPEDQISERGSEPRLERVSAREIRKLYG